MKTKRGTARRRGVKHPQTAMKDRRARQAEEARGRRRERNPEPRNPCSVVGCPYKTTERKPYCLDHIGQNDHALSVAAQMKDREGEVVRVKKRGWRAVNVHGSRAQEIVEHLAVVGVQTPKVLANMFELSAAVLDSYITALEKKGLVSRAEIPSPRYKSIKIIACGDASKTFLKQNSG